MTTFLPLPLLKNSGGEPAQGVVVLRATADFTASDGSFISKASSTGRVVDGVLKTEGGAALSAPATPTGIGMEMIFQIYEKDSRGVQAWKSLRWLVAIPATATVAIDALVHLEPASVSGAYVPSAAVQVLLDAATASSTAAANSATLAGTRATAAETARAAAVVAKNAAEASAVSVVRGGANGVAPLDGAGLLPDANLPTRLGVSELDTTIDGKIAAGTSSRNAALEMMPFTIYGHSWTNGGAGSDNGTRFFDRLAARLHMLTPTNRGESGRKMSEMQTRVAATWVANSRGVVGIGDGILNDSQSGTSGSTATVVEAWRSVLAYLTASTIIPATSQTFAWGTGWTSGVSSTVGSTAQLATASNSLYLLVGFVTGSGGTLTVKDGSTTIATITTGGYGQAFTGAVKLVGMGTAQKTLTLTLTVGSVTVVGLASPGMTPPLIVWYQAGATTNVNATQNALLVSMQSACAAILGDFPTVLTVAPGSAWDPATMLGPDNLHPNDRGNSYIADVIVTAVKSVAIVQGLNQLTRAVASLTYVSPTIAPTAATYASDSFDRANSTLGTIGSTTVGSYPWTFDQGGKYDILSNTAIVSPTGGAYINDGQANGTLSVKLPYSIYENGLLFRRSMTDGDLAGLIVYRSTTFVGYRLISRSTSGAYTTIGTYGGAAAVDDVLSVSMNGATIVILVNGTEIGRVTNTTNQISTRHGMWGNSNARFDNWAHTDAITV